MTPFTRTSPVLCPPPPTAGELTDADRCHGGGPRARSGHLQGQNPALRVMFCRLPSSFVHLFPSVFSPGHSLLVDSSSCLILGFWKREGGLACSCVPLAVGSARGARGRERGQNPNLHLPEEAGRCEHPCHVCHRGTRMEGLREPAGRPCPPSRGAGTAVQLAATVAGPPQQWGGRGAGRMATAFKLSLLLLFFFKF